VLIARVVLFRARTQTHRHTKSDIPLIILLTHRLPKAYSDIVACIRSWCSWLYCL